MLINDINEIENNKNKGFLSILLGAYVVSIVLGLPLVFRDRYFDILVFKYYYYCFCTIVMILLLLLYFIVKKFKYRKSINYVKKIKESISKFTFLDRCIIIYWFIAFISTISSNYVYEAFWGKDRKRHV